jgi:FkbM family methyltransferase
MYSQHNEEEIILNYFKDMNDGTFLDLGAYDGKTFSNVRALAEQRNWKGLCVEASPQCFIQLEKNMREFREVEVLCAAVGTSNEVLRFYDSGGAVASTDKAHYEKWKEHQQDFEPILVAQVNVKDLVTQYGPFDFVTIDIEGTTLDVFKHLPVSGTRLVCIELDPGVPESEVASVLPAGFQVIGRTPENLLIGV